MRKIFSQVSVILALWIFPAFALAQEQEVTITSREVVERLTRLEEGQKALAQRLEDVNTSLNKRIDDLRAEMNQRFDDIMTLLQIIISALVALVLAIAGAGFVMWRKILAVDATVQTKIGLDQAVREQVIRLEQEMGFVKGRLRELSEALEKK
jgi:uncharacterized protein (UPF0335 family)